MGSSYTTPDFDGWLQTAWGAGGELWCNGGALFTGASNLVFGTNPAYTLNDFLSVYPKFFGLPTLVPNCATVIGTAIVTVPSVVGLLYGQFLVGAGIPNGSIIIGIGSDSVTINQNATITGSTALQVYEQAPIPVAVIQLYLNLAQASLVEERWEDSWYISMALFIAHYCTLYAKSDSTEVMETLTTALHGETPSGAVPGTVYTLSGPPPGSGLQSLTKNGLFLVPGTDYTLGGQTITLPTATVGGDVLWATWPVQTQTFTSGAPSGAAIAAQGLAGGIQTSKSVGDVSVGYQALASLESWGAWNLTSYGQQLATMAKIIGMGPMGIY